MTVVNLIQAAAFAVIVLTVVLHFVVCRNLLWHSLYRNKLPALVLTLNLLIVFGIVLPDYGLADLYWSRGSWSRFLAAWIVGLMTFMVFYAIFLVDDRVRSDWRRIRLERAGAGAGAGQALEAEVVPGPEGGPNVDAEEARNASFVKKLAALCGSILLLGWRILFPVPRAMVLLARRTARLFRRPGPAIAVAPVAPPAPAPRVEEPAGPILARLRALWEPRNDEIGELVEYVWWASLPWLLLAGAPALLPLVRPADWPQPSLFWLAGLVGSALLIRVIGHFAFFTSFQWFWRRTYREALALTSHAVPSRRAGLAPYLKFWRNWAGDELGLSTSGGGGGGGGLPPFPSRRNYIAWTSRVNGLVDSVNLLIIVAIIYALSVVLELSLWFVESLVMTLGDGRAAVSFLLPSAALGALMVAVWVTLPRAEAPPGRPNPPGADDYRRGLGITLFQMLGLVVLAILLNYIRHIKYHTRMANYPVDYTIIFTAPVSIGAMLALALAAYTFLVTRRPAHQVVCYSLVLGALALNGYQTYKVVFPGLEDYYARGDGAPLDEAFYDRRVRRSYHEDADPDLIPEKGHLLKSRAVLNAWKDDWDRRKQAASRGSAESAAPQEFALPRPKLAIVVASGGAARSAIWTVVVLDAIERRIPGVPRGLRLVTGASGGMVGAANYVTRLNLGSLAPGPGITPNLAGTATLKQRFLDYPDMLTPIVARLVLRDVPSLFCPMRLSRDRGIVLERQFSILSRDLTDTTFADLYDAESRGAIPSLVLSPMMVEDGRRLLISNLDLDALALNQGPLVGEEKRTGSGWAKPGAAGAGVGKVRRGDPDEDSFKTLSRSAVEFFRIFPQAHQRFRVGTAVRMNATFPYVSPVLNLPTAPTRRVIDAGVFDNYGVNLAASWVFQNAEWLADHTSGVVLIQVRAFSNEQRLLNAEREMVGDASGHKSTFDHIVRYLGDGTQFLSSPLSAIGTARLSINYYRNDGQVALLGEWFRVRTGDDQFFRTVVFSCDQERLPSTAAAPTGEASRPTATAPETLSWTLSDEEVNQILGRIDRDKDPVNARRLDELVAWWNTGHSASPVVGRRWEFARPHPGSLAPRGQHR